MATQEKLDQIIADILEQIRDQDGLVRRSKHTNSTTVKCNLWIFIYLSFCSIVWDNKYFIFICMKELEKLV